MANGLNALQNIGLGLLYSQNPQTAYALQQGEISRLKEKENQKSMGQLAQILAGVQQQQPLPAGMQGPIPAPKQLTPQQQMVELANLGTPQAVNALLELQKVYAPQAVAPIKVGAGETVIDPRTGQEIFRAPTQPAKPNFQLKEVEGVGLVRVDPNTGKFDVVVEQKLGAGMPKLTEEQGKSTAFLNRMQNANKILTSLENSEDFNPAGLFDTYARKVASGETVTSWLLGSKSLANTAMGKNNQKYLQSQRDFLAGILRGDTGAAITKEEFAMYTPLYFPQAGDTKETLAQKQMARQKAMEGTMFRAGAGANILGGQQPATQGGFGAATDPLGLRK